MNPDYDKLNTIDFDQLDAVFFDIDNTLYDYKSAHEIAISELYSQVNERLKSLGILSQAEFLSLYNESRQKVREEHKNSSMTRSRYLSFLKVFEAKSEKFNTYKLAFQMEEKYWNNLVSSISLINPKVEAFLSKCKKQQIPVCAVTDMQTRFQIMKIEKMQISHLINYIVSSEDVNCEKPDAKIFEYAMDKVKAKAERIIMIGDDYKKDILGAKHLGIKTLHLGYHIK